MHILLITDPLDTLKLHKDTTFAIMQEASLRGHALHVAQIHQLSVESGRILVDASTLTLTGYNNSTHPDWYRLGPTLRQQLQAFNAVVMRKDPPFDLSYLYASHLFSLAEAQGVKIFSSGQALRDYNEKLAILQFPDLIAPTLVTSEAHRIRAFVKQHLDVIVKPLDSMGGNSIFRLRPDDANLSVIIETITCRGKRIIMVQRYIPEILDGDKRIVMINGEAVPWCLARIPATGEIRGNLAAGARGEARELTPHDWEIARTIGPELRRRGIFLAGLDVIGQYLTEINITSPTCFREIMDQTDINVAGLYLDALEKQCGTER